MRERGTDQIGIEQGYDTTDAGDAKPECHVVWLVRHEETDGVAAGETQVERPAGIPIRPLRERAKGQALAIGGKGRRLAKLIGEFLDHCR